MRFVKGRCVKGGCVKGGCVKCEVGDSVWFLPLPICPPSQIPLSH